MIPRQDLDFIQGEEITEEVSFYKIHAMHLKDSETVRVNKI